MINLEEITSRTKLIPKDIIDILSLVRSENVGIKTFYHLINIFGSAKKALENIQEMSLRGGRNKPIKLYSKKAADLEIATVQKLGGNFIPYTAKTYPKLLMQISDPPPIISYIGNVELFNSKCMAVVGTRNASLAGRTFASQISKKLVERGFTIVSGLARGIDTAAHKASLPFTISVIAGGLGHVYPPENKDLYKQILDVGLMVSELAPNMNPTPRHFPQRNRIISGLSLGVLVVEATLRSGSLITARLGLEQNREIFAVPGFPMDPRSAGTNSLIKSGAHIVDSIDDIILNLPNVNQMNMEDKFDLKDNTKDFTVNAPCITDQMRKEVLRSLSLNPISIDLLLREFDFPVQVLHTVLVELELAGKISRHSGNKVALMH